MAILVSGGAGYIGSHTCIELLNAGYDVVVADNYYNASPVVLDRIKQITGKDFRFYKADMTKHEDVEHIFSECPDITAVIQFAAYKAVGESVSKPIEYYYNNLNCTLVILDVMRHHNCHNFVFSSSATVYGDPASVPITEDFPTGATTNPYGTTKVFTERILQDVCKADPSLNVALLRYFNPIGAHKSGLIGEDPNGIPNNLMPYIAKVAVGKLEKVHVFGNDYPTPDGTGVRDYIHVVDLARGHVCAIKKLETNCGLFICNLGTGKGYSVLDVIHAFSKACGKEIPYVIDPRRPGDIAECYADPTKAKNELGWVAEYGIEEMCADSWNWQKHNPDGYHTVKERINTEHRIFPPERMRCFFMCKLLPSKPDGFARFPFLSSAVTSVPLFVTCGDISPRRGENLSRPGEVVLGEGASGETVHFAIQPETVPPCQKPNPLSHRCAMPAPPRGELLGFFRSAQIKLPLRGSWRTK